MVVLIVNQIYAGLIKDVDLLRAVLLALLENYVGKKASEAGTELGAKVPEAILVLQACLNRLILFA